jgi:hypothetical protein
MLKLRAGANKNTTWHRSIHRIKTKNENRGSPISQEIAPAANSYNFYGQAKTAT